MSFAWTDERVETLKKSWKEGLSASQIAGLFANELSRNAVIGKIHRLSLPGRAPTTGRPKGSPDRQPRRPRSKPIRPAYISKVETHAPQPKRQLPPPKPIEDIIVPISLGVQLLDLNDTMCKWPIGDPGADGFHFCGHKQFQSLPYCEYHARIAYQPVSDRRREPEWAA